MNSFFDPSSPLELNVSADLREELNQAVAALSAAGNEAFLPPSAFDKIHNETKNSLKNSFQRFVFPSGFGDDSLLIVRLFSFLLYSARNAERNRARFAKCVGAMTFLLGLIPTIVCALMGQHRGWRALGLPLWWFGMVVFVGGVRKVRMLPSHFAC